MNVRLAISAALAGTALAAGVAYASIPDGSGVIHGCYQTNKGSLRVIDSSMETCSSSETPLDWNRTGPQGPQGPTGPQGPQGPQGQQGPPGVSGYEQVKKIEVVSVPVSSRGRVTVSCPGGKKLVGGGGSIDGLAWLAGSEPDSLSPDTTWLVDFENRTNGTVNVFVVAWAICMTAS